MLALIAEIVVVISPKFRAVDAVLADWLEALVARSRACHASPFSANGTLAPYLVLLDYRTA